MATSPFAKEKYTYGMSSREHLNSQSAPARWRLPITSLQTSNADFRLGKRVGSLIIAARSPANAVVIADYKSQTPQDGPESREIGITAVSWELEPNAVR